MEVIKWLTSVGADYGILLLGWVILLLGGPPVIIWLVRKLEAKDAALLKVSTRSTEALHNLASVLEVNDQLRQMNKDAVEQITKLTTLIDERLPRK